jgi:hypothetical protein
LEQESLADQEHKDECTFKPAINRARAARSQKESPYTQMSPAKR